MQHSAGNYYQNGGMKLLYELSDSQFAGVLSRVPEEKMGHHGLKRYVGAVLAGSLLLSSTAAVAAAPAPVQQADPWAVLTAMSDGAPAAAMCGSSAAAANAQATGGCVLPVTDAPPPVPVAETVPPPVVGGGAGINPLFIALIAIAAGIGIFLAVNNSGNANSPA
jgi:hypothetical protein